MMFAEHAVVTGGVSRFFGRTRWREGPALTPRTEQMATSAANNIADGARAVRLTVLVFLLIDVVTTQIGHVAGLQGLGPTGVVPAVQTLLTVAAAATTMWHRVRSAVILTAIVLVLAFALRPAGEEIWLQVIIGAAVAIRGNRWQLGLLVTGQLGYAVALGFQLERLHPSWGWDAFWVTVVAALFALGVGLGARWLLRARDLRRLAVQQLEREQADIRAVERTRLADELQLIVTEGLATIEDELDDTARRANDIDCLRSGLARIDVRCRSLLAELRSLLDALRLSPAAEAGHRADALSAAPRRWVDLMTARHVRMAGSAVFALLAVRAAPGLIGNTEHATVLVQVIGLLAWAIALWSPVVGASVAAVALMVFVLLGGGSYWDALGTTLLCGIGGLRLGPRRFWFVIPALAGYTGLLAIAEEQGHLLHHTMLVGYLGFAGIAAGLTVRHFVTAREESVRRVLALSVERERMEAEERSAVARELHDVVAHALSVTTMQVMATSMSDDPGLLADTLTNVRRSTETAQQELSTLLHAMRGPATDQARPGPLVTPLATAAALARQLDRNGYRAVLDIDPAADALDSTTQRTVSRIMQEAATNILRYAPAGSACSFTLVIGRTESVVGPDQVGGGESGSVTGVRLVIVSALAVSKVRSDLSLGWGLRGIRERVELTSGTFAAGPDHGRWVLAITLPAPSVAGGRLRSPAAAGAGAGAAKLPGA